MSQKIMEKENSQKTVLTQIQNQAIIVSSQGEVKSQLQAESQDRVPSQVQDSQASCCVASQGQVLTQAQLASQNGVSSQATVASQGDAQIQAQLASQPNVSSQGGIGTQFENVSSQPTVPTRSQLSSQNAVSSRKRDIPRDCVLQCCQCCKDVPVLQAKKREYRKIADNYFLKEIGVYGPEYNVYGDKFDKKQNE